MKAPHQLHPLEGDLHGPPHGGVVHVTPSYPAACTPRTALSPGLRASAVADRAWPDRHRLDGALGERRAHAVEAFRLDAVDHRCPGRDSGRPSATPPMRPPPPKQQKTASAFAPLAASCSSASSPAPACRRRSSGRRRDGGGSGPVRPRSGASARPPLPRGHGSHGRSATTVAP